MSNTQQSKIDNLLDRALLATLELHGTAMSGAQLRDELGWSPVGYARSIERCKAQGKVSVGRGQGGVVSLVPSN